MISILKPGHAKIMHLFYLDKTAKLHVREIARRTKLHLPSTSSFLKELEKDSILKSEKDGNQKKFSLKYSNKTYLMFQFFDLQRSNTITNIRKNAISFFLDHLKEQPIIALLFGSTAKNTYQEHSDIDLLIIVKKEINTQEAEKYADAQTAIKINCIQITIKEFKDELKLKKDNVIQSAIATGYPIKNNLEYYKLCYERV